MWFQIFFGRGAEHVELFDLSSEIEGLGPRFEKSRCLFGLFRGAPLKSETTFVNQLSILFHKCGLRFSGSALERDAKNPTSPPSGAEHFRLFGKFAWELEPFSPLTFSPRDEIHRGPRLAKVRLPLCLSGRPDIQRRAKRHVLRPASLI